MNSKLWICEKPKQGLLVAERIGITKRADGYIETKDGIVTWCIGHLVGFKSPGDYSDRWRSWSLESLPIVPERFDLQPLNGKNKQLKVIGNLLKNTSHVIIATDGDREGELLGREILDFHHWSGKIDRMWNTNLDSESIDNALKSIKPGDDYQNLYQAALARSEADYITGMSLTRAATKVFSDKDVLSVGRVQTAVLGMIVRRGKEIGQFESRPYYELVSHHSKDGVDYSLKYSPKAESRLYDKSAAKGILGCIEGQTVSLSVETKNRKKQPPPLFNLLALQQAANTALGWSASEVKAVAQNLYDDGLISYPRTDCKYLPNEQEKDAETILSNLSGISKFAPYIDEIGTDLVFRKNVFDTDMTTAHHAIVPSKKPVDISNLDDKQRALYLIVCRRYIAVFMPDYEFESTSVKFQINGCEFKAIGNTPLKMGWKQLYQNEEDESDKDNQVFPALNNGESVILDNVEIKTLKTKPPARFTQSSLLSAMENISVLIEDEKLRALFRQRLRDNENAGIGTPATRDTYLDILVQRNYVSVNRNKIYESELGVKLIESLPDKVSDPIETAVMESYLDRISIGKYDKKRLVDLVINDTEDVIKILSDYAGNKLQETEQYSCKKCDGHLTRRKGKHGAFWSCSNYPDCDYKMSDKQGKPVEPKQTSKKECPTCKSGFLVKRKTKQGKNKGKEFWACSVYDCKHFEWIKS